MLLSVGRVDRPQCSALLLSVINVQICSPTDGGIWITPVLQGTSTRALHLRKVNRDEM